MIWSDRAKLIVHSQQTERLRSLGHLCARDSEAGTLTVDGALARVPILAEIFSRFQRKARPGRAPGLYTGNTLTGACMAFQRKARVGRRTIVQQPGRCESTKIIRPQDQRQKCGRAQGQKKP